MMMNNNVFFMQEGLLDDNELFHDRTEYEISKKELGKLLKNLWKKGYVSYFQKPGTSVHVSDSTGDCIIADFLLLVKEDESSLRSLGESSWAINGTSFVAVG